MEEEPFAIRFTDHHLAWGVMVQRPSELAGAMEAIGLRSPRATLVLVGGAGGMDGQSLQRLSPLFAAGLAPLAQTLGLAVIDGGTQSGVMQSMGEARAAVEGTFPLIGVTACGTVALPATVHPSEEKALLDPHHTHFVLVPGDHWGDESPWLSDVAAVLAGTSPSATVLINGGEIARDDVSRSVAASRPVVVVAGTGRTADALADAVRDGGRSEREQRLAASGLLRIVDIKEGPGALFRMVRDLLEEQEVEHL